MMRFLFSIFTDLTVQLLALCDFVLFYPVCRCQRTLWFLASSKLFLRVWVGGQDWTRTSDPRLIKAVL
jgi:hypothetical protein